MPTINQALIPSKEQLTCIRKILRAIPYYRSYAGFTDLDELPIIEKSTLLAHYPQFISENFPPEKEAIMKFLGIRRRDARKRYAERLWKERGLIVNSTSGTTGVPLYVFKRIPESWKVGVNIWKARKHFDDSVAAAKLYPMLHAPAGSAVERFSKHDEATSVAELYRKLSSMDIRWIHATPRQLQKHMAAMKSLNLTSCGCDSLQYVEVSGAPMDGDTRSEVEQFFRARIVNQYGCQETLVIGYTDAANGFKIIDGIYLEVLDGDGRRIDTPEVIGRVAVTNLSLELVPFIRYLTGDRASWKLVVDPITLEEKRLLILAEDRDNNMIFHKGCYVSGTHLFKEVVYAVNHKIGQYAIAGKVRFMQVRQVAEDEIVLVLNSFPAIKKYHRIFTEICNSEDRKIKVHLRVLSKASVEKIDMTKHKLFVKDLSGQLAVRDTNDQDVGIVS